MKWEEKCAAKASMHPFPQKNNHKVKMLFVIQGQQKEVIRSPVSKENVTGQDKNVVSFQKERQKCSKIS